MAMTNLAALAEVRAALRKYEAAVEGASLKATTKRTYIVHAQHFVRWLAGDFTPGIRK